MVPSIWTGIYPENPLHESVRLLHTSGWRNFEVSTNHLVSIETDPDPDGLIEKAGAVLQELECRALQAHPLLEADVADPDDQKREEYIRRLLRHIDIAHCLGVKDVVIHPGGKRDTAPAQEESVRKLNIDAFRRLGDHAGQLGIRIGLENIPKPWAVTGREMVGLLKAIDHPAIGLTLDTSHANMTGQSSAQVAREMSPYLIATHLSDNDGSWDQHRTPGGGTIDWPALITALRDVNYQGYLNLEIPGERHPVLALRELNIRHALDVAHWLTGLAAEE